MQSGREARGEPCRWHVPAGVGGQHEDRVSTAGFKDDAEPHPYPGRDTPLFRLPFLRGVFEVLTVRAALLEDDTLDTNSFQGPVISTPAFPPVLRPPFPASKIHEPRTACAK